MKASASSSTAARCSARSGSCWCSFGTLIAAWLEAAPSTDAWGEPALGIALCAVGAASSFTAVGRWIEGYRLLAAREAAQASAPAPIVPLRPARPEPAPAPAAAQAQMRITGEHTA